MKKTKYYIAAAICVILVIIVAVCCFTDAFTPSSGASPLPSITEEIIYAYYNTVLSEPRPCAIEELSLRFRGTFSDTYVVFVDGPFSYSPKETEEFAAGLRFTYPDSQTMVAYHQGSFYSLAEAYARGFLSKEDLLTLRKTYVQLGADRLEKGEVPFLPVPCTHIPKEPTEPTSPNGTTRPSEPTEPTTPTESTQPTEPVDIMELLPDIPAVTELVSKPETLTELTLVHCFYEHSASWRSKKGFEQEVTVQLPAIVPFCEGAIEINESIRNTYQYWVESVRRDFTNQRDSIQMIYYKTSLYNNILTIQVSVWEDFNVIKSRYWILDVATGQQLTTPDLAQRYLQESYPTFLKHCYYNTYAYFQNNPLMNAKNQEELMRLLPTNPFYVLPSYTLYPDSVGKWMIALQIPEYDVNLVLSYDAFDADGWEGNDESGYHWLFNVKADGAGADIHGRYLLTSFFQYPHTFVKMLSQEDNTTITKIAQHLNYSLYLPEEIARYKDLCDDMYLTSSDSKVAETAQILYSYIQPL